MKLFILSVFVLGACAEDNEDKDVCYLLDGKDSDKPFPSLTQCYKNNQEACCVSAHDATIEGQYAGLLSTTCLREYQELEHYFCLGCNPNMFNYIHWYDATAKCYGDSTATEPCEFKPFVCTTDLCGPVGSHGWKKHEMLGMIKVCTSFLEQLLYTDSTCSIASDDCKIDKYDNCGLNLDVAGEDGEVGWYPSAHFVDGDGRQDPLKFLEEIRPPYFSGKFHISTAEYSAKDSRMVAFELGRVTDNTCVCATIESCNCEPSPGFPYFEAWTNKPTNAPDGTNLENCFSAAPSVRLSVLAVLAVFAAHFAGQFM